MPSDAQLAANRANALKSTGPRTEEGKARSSQNGARHGLAARTLALSTESDEEYQQLQQEYEARYAPQDEVEHHCLQELIACAWRLRRAWGVESATLELALLKQRATLSKGERAHLDETQRTALAFRTAGPVEGMLPLLMRYETRLARQYDRALARLRLLQANRPPRSTGELPSEPNFPVDLIENKESMPAQDEAA